MKIKLNKLNPKTLEEAIELLEKNLDSEDIEYIKENKPESVHLFIGMNLRNDWGLWQNSELAQFFKNVYGLGHADDMSGIILSSLFAKVRGEKFLVKDEIKKYKDYWLNKEIDPLTQEKINV